MSSKSSISISEKELGDRILKDKFFGEVIDCCEKVKQHGRDAKYAFRRKVRDIVIELYKKVLSDKDRKLFIRRLPKLNKKRKKGEEKCQSI